jgi:hypothetical protein
MKSSPNPDPGGNPRNRLKEALGAYTRAEQRSLLRQDRSACLTLIRLRDIAQPAPQVGSATSAEVVHLQSCRRCAASLRMMQSELDTVPKKTLDKSIVVITKSHRKRALWLAESEKRARLLFARLHRHDAELERAHSEVWTASHELARALRHCRCTGTPEDLEILLAMTSAAIRAATSDPLTPWSSSVDSSWPVLQLLVEAAAEMHAGSNDEIAKLADVYAAVVRDAPVPLKVVLTYGISGLFDRGPHAQRTALMITTRIADSDDPPAHIILTMLAHTIVPQIATHVDSVRWNQIAAAARPHYRPLLRDTEEQLDALRDVIAPSTPHTAVAAVVRKSVYEGTERMLVSADAVETMLRLIALQQYLQKAAHRLDQMSESFAEFVLEDVARLVIRRAVRQEGRMFLATELLAAVRPVAGVAQVMAHLLERGNVSLRRAFFVSFVESYERASSSNPGANPRFAAEGGDRTFEGGAPHPFDVFGEHAATLATDDPEIARLVEWSNARLEALAYYDVLQEPAEA